MKKIICVLMAVLTLGCLASCTLFKDHDDGKCDICDTEGSVIPLNPVNKWEDNKELCNDCAKEHYSKEEYDSLSKEILKDAFGG